MKKLVWTLVSQVPLGGAAALWQKGLVRHPAAAVGIAVVYELLVFFIIFGSKVWKVLEAQAAAKPPCSSTSP